MTAPLRHQDEPFLLKGSPSLSLSVCLSVCTRVPLMLSLVLGIQPAASSALGACSLYSTVAVPSDSGSANLVTIVTRSSAGSKGAPGLAVLELSSVSSCSYRWRVSTPSTLAVAICSPEHWHGFFYSFGW